METTMKSDMVIIMTALRSQSQNNRAKRFINEQIIEILKYPEDEPVSISINNEIIWERLKPQNDGGIR